MTLTNATMHDPPSNRPVGRLLPTHELAVRARKALAERRFKDAHHNVEGMPDDSVLARAWQHLLDGEILVDEQQLKKAQPALLRAAATALLAGLGPEASINGEALRLASLAFGKLGVLFRRQDRAAQAIRAHHCAFHLQCEFGSNDELWETAVNLGLDADLARDHDAAQRWHRLAIGLGTSVAEEPLRKQCVACTNLTTSLTQGHRFPEAIEAGRQARSLWQSHDIGSAESARAEMRLGHALLLHGEGLHESASDDARSVLDEATDCLGSAYEALLPFGRATAADAQWCAEQRDFAQRLLESLTSE